MTLTNDFTIISSASSQSLTPEYEALTSGKISDPDIQITTALRAHYPELTLTVTPAQNVPLVYFANLGYATATLDTEEEMVFRWRGYRAPPQNGGQGSVGDSTWFAKYHYRWADEDWILYTVVLPMMGTIQYILKEPGPGENAMSNCSKTDALMMACVKALTPDQAKFIYVYDGYWYASTVLWEEVKKASWHDVILDQKTKDALTGVSKNFFDSREQYERYGVAWKRGLIFHGPVGNGKTVSVKALMNTMYARDPAIPTLYVKSAPNTYNIAAVFAQARRTSPCLLIMEDIETIVTPRTRSYFFNECDGLANNNGILMIASTNYLDRLDPGLSKRPSRFDRKYLFPLPNANEREQYAQYWRAKIIERSKGEIDFPAKLCKAIAGITEDFSFAYMQEAFIATLLAIARGDGDDDHDDHDDHERIGEGPDGTREEALAKLDAILNRARIAHGKARDAPTAADEGGNADRGGNAEVLIDSVVVPPPRSATASGAPNEGPSGGGGGDDKPLTHYRFWRVMRAQVKILREDMGSSTCASSARLPATDDNFDDAQTRFQELALTDAAMAHSPPPPCPALGGAAAAAPGDRMVIAKAGVSAPTIMVAHVGDVNADIVAAGVEKGRQFASFGVNW